VTAKRKTKPEPLSWTPERRGKIFCAPACGANCTLAAFNLATARADVLCARLGHGWRPRVWENLGWHYCAVSSCGRWKVHAHHDHKTRVSYSAFLGDDGPGGLWAESGETPEAAMRNTWAAAEQRIEQFVSFLTAEAWLPRGAKADPSASKRSKRT
jgi:hypothetical protein